MSKRLPWFRMFHEARTDRKLDVLPDDEHRVWFSLLCYASEQDERGVIEVEDTLALECARGDDALLERTLQRLEKLKIIERADGRISFLNYLKRQYDKPSDYPQAVRERVSRHRQGVTETNETSLKRDVTHCNAVEERRKEERRVEERTETGAPQADARPARAAPKPPKRQDELWDAVVVTFGEPNELRRGEYNRAVGVLRKAGAKPDEVAIRKGRYELEWPDNECTPLALAKWWERFARDTEPRLPAIPGQPARASPSRFEVQARQAAQEAYRVFGGGDGPGG